MLFDSVVRGIAELHPLDAAGGRAEAAFSVEPGWQGRGIGTRLVARLLEDAIASGYDKIFLCCEVRNRSMRNIAGRFGGSVLFAEGECVISFPKASRDSTRASLVAPSSFKAACMRWLRYIAFEAGDPQRSPWAS
jgi:RimJ/RimL family protein N-acetyltransferase